MTNLLILMILHFVADFICQPRVLAENKSHDMVALLAHVLIYSFVVGLGMVLFITYVSPLILLVLFIPHLVTDYLTSKLSTHYYKKENYYAFFNVIGFDQLLHFVALYYLALPFTY